MIECPSCGRQHRPGTLFCSECGVYLLTGGPLRTEPLPESDLPASRADPWATNAPVVTIACNQPRSIMSQMRRPILATLIAPEKVPTTRQSGS